MMGKKKLAQIRHELAQEMERVGLQPATWYGEQLEKLQAKPLQDAADLESLQLIRDALASLQGPRHANAKKAMRTSRP
jgi:hypothetical protein